MMDNGLSKDGDKIENIASNKLSDTQQIKDTKITVNLEKLRQ